MMAALLHNDNPPSSGSTQDRVVIHLDLDAFYVACERELNPELRNCPLGVSQYNPYGTLEETAPEDIYRRLVRTPTTTNTTTTITNNPDDANGSLIAVSYEARAAGVRRNDRGMDASHKCPSLHIVVVPVKHGKSDIGMYRRASKRVMQVLTRAIQEETNDNNIPVEVASIDEVYVDVTGPVEGMVKRMLDNDALWTEYIDEACACTTVGGVEVLSDAAEAANALNKTDLRKGSRLQVLDSTAQQQDEGSLAWWHRPKSQWSEMEVRLACGVLLATRARKKVVEAFDGGVFTLSAGVSSNKTLAKLASGFKKPNRQTLINPTDPMPLEMLFHPLPLSRIRGLGGKFGTQVSEKFGVTTVGQLSQVPLTTLQSSLEEKTARFLYDIARGICRDPVTPRTKPKSIASSKTFRGKMAIVSNDEEKLTKWVGELCSELTERLEVDGQEYKRNATTLVVSVMTSEEASNASKQCRAPRKLTGYHETALQLIRQLVEAAKSRLRVEKATITCISIAATQFENVAAGSSSIMAAFERGKGEGKNTKSVSPLRSRYQAMQPRKPKPKPSVMESWLSSEAKKMAGAKRSSSDAEGSAASKRQAGSSKVAAKTHAGGHEIQPSENSRTRPVALPTMDEIDLQVLEELPEELRASLLKDIGRAHPTKKTNVGIQNFFHRKG